MESLYASEIIKVLGADFSMRRKNMADFHVDSISIDSRTVQPQSLFIAIDGEHFDGHDFINDAFDKGTCLAVAHKPVRTDHPVVYVKDTARALLKLAGYYRSKFNIPVAGITGSVGKTSTKEMIYAVLSEKYNTLKTKGNLNNEIGLPLTVFGLDGSVEAAVIEMGMSNTGEISRLSRTAKPNAGVITGIGVSHIESLGSREAIMSAKLEIIDGLMPNSPLFVCGDNDMLRDFDTHKAPLIKYGIENKLADYVAENITQNSHIDIQNGQVECSSEFDVCFKGERYRAGIPALGRHNILNALAAFAVGIHYGLAPEQIIAGLAKYESTGMRQKALVKHGVTVVEDCYNASPESVKASVEAFCELPLPAQGKRIAVLGDMLELGDISREEHIKTGEYVAGKEVDIIYTVGDMSRYCAQGAEKCGHAHVKFWDDRQALIKELARELKPGDSVLFKASRGVELEEIIEGLYKTWTSANG